MIKSGFSKFTKSSEQCKIPVDEIQIKPANRYQGNYIKFVLNLMSCTLKENQARCRMQQKNYGSDKLFSCNYLVPYEAFKSLYLQCDPKNLLKTLEQLASRKDVTTEVKRPWRQTAGDNDLISFIIQKQPLRGVPRKRYSKICSKFTGERLHRSVISIKLQSSFLQKQPPKGVLKKRCSENMQQIYRRISMPKCDFNKVAKQLY